MLYAQYSSDAKPGSGTQSSLDAQSSSDLPSKLHILVHSFAAYQDTQLPPQATFYKLVHIFATYALKLHVL